MRLFPRAGNYMVSLKDQLWIHDYDWESCNDRKCDKDQESDDDQKPHNSGCCKSESEKTIELSLFSSSGLSISLIKCLKGQKCLGLLFNVKNQKWLSQSVSDQ